MEFKILYHVYKQEEAPEAKLYNYILNVLFSNPIFRGLPRLLWAFLMCYDLSLQTPIDRYY